LLGVEIAAMARLHLQPRLIFDRCTDFLLQKRIQVPKAGTLAELIRLGLNQRKTALVKLMEAQSHRSGTAPAGRPVYPTG